jgi:hypothetical protein
LPPRISFIIRSATTPFASSANIIKGLNIRRPSTLRKHFCRADDGSTAGSTNVPPQGFRLSEASLGKCGIGSRNAARCAG